MTGSMVDCPMPEHIKQIRLCIQNDQYQESEKEIITMMTAHPHSAIPHNLYGVLLEKEQEHIEAMKHFRAAYALDPAYIPARYNMEQYGSFGAHTFSPAYSEADCAEISRKGKDTGARLCEERKGY